MEIVQQITDGKDKLAEPGELLSKEATELLEDFERRSAKLEDLLATDADDAQTQSGARSTRSEEPAAGSTGELADLQLENDTLRGQISSSDSRGRELENEISRLHGLLSQHEINSAPPLPEEDRKLCEEIGIGEDTYLRLKKSLGQPTEQPRSETPQDPAHKVFIARVDVKAHGWRAIRQKPEFAAFCNTRPGGEYGQSYLEMLKDAARTFDADTTAMVYNTFIQSSPASPRKPSREAADSRSKGGDGIPVSVEPWNEERIAQFDRDLREGKIKRGSEKYKKLRASYDNFLSNLTVSG